MKKVICIACVLLLQGCLHNDSNYSAMREKAITSATKMENYSEKFETKFDECMSAYIKKNINTIASASDLAEAALSDCYEPLYSYQSAREAYHFNAITAPLYGKVFSPQKAVDTAKYNSDKETQSLSDYEKRLAIKHIVEAR